jgi:hypothetical protein
MWGMCNTLPYLTVFLISVLKTTPMHFTLLTLSKKSLSVPGKIVLSRTLKKKKNMKRGKKTRRGLARNEMKRNKIKSNGGLS